MNSMIQGGYDRYGRRYAAGRDDLRVMFCLSGHAVIRIDGHQYEIKSNDGVFIFSGVDMSFGERSVDFRINEIVMPGNIRQYAPLRNLAVEIALLTKNPVFHLHPSERDNFIRLTELCANIKYTSGRYSREYALNIYLSLLYLMCEAAGRDKGNVPGVTTTGRQRQYSCFIEFLNLLRRYCPVERNVGFYAGKLCITPKYLSMAVKAVSGRTAHAWIGEFVVSVAKQHLRHTGKTIQEISDMLNFPTQSFFGRYFKRVTGMSPVTYKLMAATA